MQQQQKKKRNYKFFNVLYKIIIIKKLLQTLYKDMKQKTHNMLTSFQQQQMFHQLLLQF